MTETVQKNISEDLKKDLDSLGHQRKKPLSFIEQACGLESIEESPASKPRIDVSKLDHIDEPSSFYVFGDAELSVEKTRSRLPKVPSNGTPEVVIENCSTSPERKSPVVSPDTGKPVRPNKRI